MQYKCALAAIKSKKQPYFAIKYGRIKKRRGHKKAIIAIARMMVVCIYHMVSEKKPFCPTDYEELMGGCKKSCVYGEIIFSDRNQICKNLLSNIITFMLSNFFSDNSIANLLNPIQGF